jgi:Flp pilus assembly protein TadG
LIWKRSVAGPRQAPASDRSIAVNQLKQATVNGDMVTPSRQSNLRRGGAAASTVIMLLVIFGIAALAIDASVLYTARNELQRSADSAALSAAGALLNQDRLRGEPWVDEVIAASRDAAVDLAARNEVRNESPVVDENTPNSGNGDIVIGHLNDPTDPDENMTFGAPSEYNTVQVTVRRDSTRNGPIGLFFARVLGVGSSDVRAQATASFQDSIAGWKVTDRTGNAELLPLALHINAWNNLLSGAVTTGDLYTFNPETGEVSDGPDGILELNLYPGSGGTQLPPGNFGTVDIGSENNSTADISRQIRYGVSAEDLAYFGGELRFNDDGYIMLNGDTGLSAGIKDDLEFIKGLPRAIPLFNQVTGPGNNSYFRVIAFSGIRIMNVRLTGAMKSKQVIVQPAYVVDDAAISDSDGSSYYVYRPPMLSR